MGEAKAQAWGSAIEQKLSQTSELGLTLQGSSTAEVTVLASDLVVYCPGMNKMKNPWDTCHSGLKVVSYVAIVLAVLIFAGASFGSYYYCKTNEKLCFKPLPQTPNVAQQLTNQEAQETDVQKRLKKRKEMMITLDGETIIAQRRQSGLEVARFNLADKPTLE